MYGSLFHIDTFFKRRNALVLLLVSAMFVGVFVSQTGHASAARATSYNCERYIAWTSVDRAEGRYVTVQYGLRGNDNSRAQYLEDGAVVPRTGTGPNGANCAVGEDGGWCDLSLISLFWSCDGTVNYNSPFYKATMFGGKNATNVYLGSAQQQWNDHEQYWSNANLLSDDSTDPTRSNAGVSASSNYPYGTVNDAGEAFINGSQIFCFGLAFREGCHANVFDARGDGSGLIGSWAGYLNPGPNGGFAVNGAYWNKIMANGVRPSNNLVGGGSFNLQLADVNTQDPWFGCFPSWDSGFPPGGTSPPGCYSPEPFKNGKISIMITYFIPANINVTATPTLQPPTLLPNDEEASSANFNAAVTISPDGQKFKTTATRDYYIQRGASTIPIAPSDVSLINTDTTFNNVTRSVSGAQVGDQICERLTVTPGSAKVDNDGNVNKVIDASHESVSCTRVIAKPYLRVYGNDVQAGAKFADASDSCSARTLNNDKATILAFVRDTSPAAKDGTNYFAGAGSQFAVSALGEITNFLSASMHTPRYNTSGKTRTVAATDLTFGNYNPAFSINNWGPVPTGLDATKVLNYGGLSGMVHCIPDFGDKEPPTFVGNQTFGGQTVAKGEKDYIVVDGDVNITGNISFANGDWGPTNDSIPSYYLVVKGNIYIDPSVTQLDGVYIAQPTSYDANGKPTAGGKIYTCYDTAAGQPIDPDNLFNNCGNQLVINGALIAQQVKFLRTKGTLKDAPSVLSPAEASSSNNIAEIINFSPETYLANPDSHLYKTTIGSSYDYITSLSPIL